MKLRITSTEMVIDQRPLDPSASTAVEMLRSALGPVIDTTPAGVSGTGRVAHWFSCGVVVLAQRDDAEFVALYVCFDEKDSSPFPALKPIVPAFRGVVEVEGLEVVGGESESSLRKMLPVTGIAGALGLRRGGVFVGFTFRAARNRRGERAGTKRLVSLSAEWGGPKPFPPRSRTRAAS